MGDQNGRPLNRGAVACRKKRQAKKWSQTDLAAKVKSTQPTVARWESAVWKPQTQQRLELEELLDIPWRWWDQPSRATASQSTSVASS